MNISKKLIYGEEAFRSIQKEKSTTEKIKAEKFSSGHNNAAIRWTAQQNHSTKKSFFF